MTTIDGTTYVAPTTTITTKGMTSTPATGMTDLTGKTTGSTTKSNGLDSSAFLKLLVAQLKYQDPSSPADSSQLMQQTSTLSMVQTTNAMAQQISAMVTTYSSMLAEQRMASAVSLVGKTVDYVSSSTSSTTTETSTTLSGKVDSVKFDATGPILSIAGKDVSLASVTAVRTS